MKEWIADKAERKVTTYRTKIYESTSFSYFMDIILGQGSVNLNIEWIGKDFRNSFNATNTIEDENEQVSKKIIISYHDTQL